MISLSLHSFHEAQNARFVEVFGYEMVLDYGDPLREYTALQETAGIIDLSARGRVCLTGLDRKRFLNGQVTSDVNGLQPGEGCYAALVTSKGKLVSDLNIYCLENEILLDFEPGLSARVSERLEKYIIADDVQIADAAPLYGMWSIVGPHADRVLERLRLGISPAENEFGFGHGDHPSYGEVYLMTRPQALGRGFDLFVPAPKLELAAQRLAVAAERAGGHFCGLSAMETMRIESGIPRFGVDMDETHLPPEAGLEARAVSYSKGCYTGQEVIARIRTYGQVAKSLRGLHILDPSAELPARGDKLLREEREVGSITSAVESPSFKAKIALGYVRRECNQIGTELELRTRRGAAPVRIVELPFRL